MTDSRLESVKRYFSEKLVAHGPTHRGVDYNSTESQEVRFLQLMRIIENPAQPYSLLDFGSGYGAMYDYLLRQGHALHYVGYDIAPLMVQKGRELHSDCPDCWFTDDLAQIPVLDYAVASGTFNMKLEAEFEAWTEIILQALNDMHNHASKGFALTC